MEALKGYLSLDATSISLLVVSALTVTLIYYRYKHSYWSRRGIVGPKPYPVVGTFLFELWCTRPLLMRQWREKYGRVFGTFNGVKPTLIVCDANILKNVMVKDAHIFPNHAKVDFLGKNTENMLFFMRDSRWKSLRSLMAFSMTSGKIKRLYPLMLDAGNELINTVSNVAKKARDGPPGTLAVLDTKTAYGCYTMDLIARSAFAMRFDSAESEQTHRKELVTFLMENMGRILWHKIVIALLTPKFLLNSVGFHLGDGKIDRRLEGLSMQIVRARRKLGIAGRRDDLLQTMLDIDATHTGIGEHLLERTENDDDESHHVASADKEELRDVLKSATKSQVANVATNYGAYNSSDDTTTADDGKAKLKITDSEIIGNCILFLIAGYETTSSLLSFATHALAHHPEAQEELYEQVSDESVNDTNRFTYERIISLPYLDAVISESLRLFPPASHMDRQASEDYRIESLNLTIPKGGLIGIPFYAIHRDPEYYEQPDSFIPERFLPENRHKLTPYTYLPFGAGIRHCLGMRFALAEAKLALARLVYNFKFAPAPGHDFPPILKPTMGLLKSETLDVIVTARTV